MFLNSTCNCFQPFGERMGGGGWGKGEMRNNTREERQEMPKKGIGKKGREDKANRKPLAKKAECTETLDYNLATTIKWSIEEDGNVKPSPNHLINS